MGPARQIHAAPKIAPANHLKNIYGNHNPPYTLQRLYATRINYELSNPHQIPPHSSPRQATSPTASLSLAQHSTPPTFSQEAMCNRSSRSGS